MWMANDGNYRELRHFSPWMRHRELEDHRLPKIIQEITGQLDVPFGDGILRTDDTVIGVELCEELFTPASPHTAMALEGTEILTNSSASHHELGKLSRRIELIKEATMKNGGIYLYANQQGCDGDRCYYDGAALIACNGKIVAQGSQFSLNEVEVVTATLDLVAVRAHRTYSSRRMQSVQAPSYPRVWVDHFRLDGGLGDVDQRHVTKALVPDARYHSFQEEIA